MSHDLGVIRLALIYPNDTILQVVYNRFKINKILCFTVLIPTANKTKQKISQHFWKLFLWLIMTAIIWSYVKSLKKGIYHNLLPKFLMKLYFFAQKTEWQSIQSNFRFKGLWLCNICYGRIINIHLFISLILQV